MHPTYEEGRATDIAIYEAHKRRIADDWLLARLVALLADLRERSDFSSRDAVFAYLGTPLPMLRARVRRIYHARRFQLWKRAQAEVAAALDASIEANRKPLPRMVA